MQRFLKVHFREGIYQFVTPKDYSGFIKELKNKRVFEPGEINFYEFYVKTANSTEEEEIEDHNYKSIIFSEKGDLHIKALFTLFQKIQIIFNSSPEFQQKYLNKKSKPSELELSQDNYYSENINTQNNPLFAKHSSQKTLLDVHQNELNAKDFGKVKNIIGSPEKRKESTNKNIQHQNNQQQNNQQQNNQHQNNQQQNNHQQNNQQRNNQQQNNQQRNNQQQNNQQQSNQQYQNNQQQNNQQYQNNQQRNNQQYQNNQQRNNQQYQNNQQRNNQQYQNNQQQSNQQQNNQQQNNHQRNNQHFQNNQQHQNNQHFQNNQKHQNNQQHQNNQHQNYQYQNNQQQKNPQKRSGYSLDNQNRNNNNQDNQNINNQNRNNQYYNARGQSSQNINNQNQIRDNFNQNSQNYQNQYGTFRESSQNINNQNQNKDNFNQNSQNFQNQKNQYGTFRESNQNINNQNQNRGNFNQGSQNFQNQKNQNYQGQNRQNKENIEHDEQKDNSNNKTQKNISFSALVEDYNVPKNRNYDSKICTLNDPYEFLLSELNREFCFTITVKNIGVNCLPANFQINRTKEKTIFDEIIQTRYEIEEPEKILPANGTKNIKIKCKVTRTNTFKVGDLFNLGFLVLIDNKKVGEKGIAKIKIVDKIGQPNQANNNKFNKLGEEERKGPLNSDMNNGMNNGMKNNMKNNMNNGMKNNMNNNMNNGMKNNMNNNMNNGMNNNMNNNMNNGMNNKNLFSNPKSNDENTQEKYNEMKKDLEVNYACYLDDIFERFGEKARKLIQEANFDIDKVLCIVADLEEGK